MKHLIGLIGCLLVKLTVAQVNIIKISPGITDTAIHAFTGTGYEHYVYVDPSAVQRHQLLVFLPGTNGMGGGGGRFNQLAASLGYHVISLMYPDDFSLSRYQFSADTGNYARGRNEIITGNNTSVQISVNRANSIENRLIKLLQYLAGQYPNQGWQLYLDKGKNITWNKVVLAGQSQGGGHAAFIAQKYLVAGVIMLASPKDYSKRYHIPPDWISGASQTPLNRYYSFVHSADDHNACTYAEQQQIWKAMGLYTLGAEVDVDKVVPPYQHTHLLISTRPQPVPHGSVVKDAAAYKQAWMYMLTAIP